MVVLDRAVPPVLRGRARARGRSCWSSGSRSSSLWDLAGIGLGIFFRGEPGLLTGVQLAPELPLEELFFLALLCYLTMNAYGVAARASRGAASRRPVTRR